MQKNSMTTTSRLLITRLLILTNCRQLNTRETPEDRLATDYAAGQDTYDDDDSEF